MTTHELKTWPQYYHEPSEKSKHFEVRKNDRNFQVDDILHLCEWDPDPLIVRRAITKRHRRAHPPSKGYTGRSSYWRVCFVQRDFIAPEWVVMVIEPEQKQEK